MRVFARIYVLFLTNKPQPLKGVSGVASCKSCVKRKKQPVWTAFLR